MKQIDVIKKEIAEINNVHEMSGYLAAINTAAAVYCLENCKEEVELDGGRIIDVSLYGMAAYLESECP